jgi:signal transduction histidine kinase
MERRGPAGALAVEPLQWCLGLFCALTGAFMLVAPHQFESPPYAAFFRYLPAWALLALAAGSALLSVPATRPGRRATAVVQLAVGLALLGLAVGFAGIGGWTGVILYSILGIGTALAALPVARWDRQPEQHGPPATPATPADTAATSEGDLLSFLFGIAAALSALAIFGGYYRPNPRMPWFGVVWIVAGPLLAWVQVRPASRSLTRIAHLLAGFSFVASGLLVALPSRAWTGVFLFCGCGLVIAFLPGLRPRLPEIGSAALRTRLSLALALATSVTLILAVAVVTDQEERLAAEQVRQLQKIEADSIAQDVGDYLSFNVARAIAVAALAGHTPMASAPQDELLGGTRSLHPDVQALAITSFSGEIFAVSGDLPVDRPTVRLLAAEAGGLAEHQQVILRFSRQDGRPLLLLTVAIPGAGGRPIGALIAAFDPSSLVRRIDRPGSRVTLADGKGQLVATLDKAGAATQPLPSGWDGDVVAGRPLRPGARLAAFARVPEVGWAVAVERPRAAALAGVRRGRDVAFLLLLLCAALAALAGVVTARRIAHPLGTLADAVDQLTAGNPEAPLGTSSITEIARLAAAFRELRDRLVARTAESERLAGELRARAEALAETDRRKDEFLAMLAHELRNPLGAIANASHLLTHLTPEEPPAPPMLRSVAVIERQVLHLVRMVDDLLDVSRITRGKVELRREPLDLVEVVRQTVEGNRTLIEGRGIELAVTLPPAPPAPLALDADLTRLEQVFSNLLRNAAKFTEAGGRIDVSVAVEGSEGVVRVADNGIGIAPELLPHIFDLFIQGEQTLDRGGAGLGIGLTMVRRLVELHGGRVAVASAGRGQGTEFTVRLPLARVAQAVAGHG